MKKPDGYISLVPVSFAIEPHLRDRLKQITREEDRTISSVVRDLVIAALDARDQPSDTRDDTRDDTERKPRKGKSAEEAAVA